MKINRLETHDRLLHLQKDQSLNISNGAEECLKMNPLSLGLQQYSPYIYIFAHPRTQEDGRTKKMLWQPRLTRPKAETNSYLFRATSNTDIVEICWMIPPQEMWSQYEKGKITENEFVTWSIEQYLSNKEQLEAPLQDDLDDEQCKQIYLKVAQEQDQDIRMDKIYAAKTKLVF